MIVKEEMLEFIAHCEARAVRLGEANSKIYAVKFYSADAEDIYFHGDEYWRFGGHEHHENCYPWNYFLCSEEEFKEILIQEKTSEEFSREYKAKTKKEEREREELRQLEHLKQKYEQGSTT